MISRVDAHSAMAQEKGTPVQSCVRAKNAKISEKMKQKNEKNEKTEKIVKMKQFFYQKKCNEMCCDDMTRAMFS